MSQITEHKTARDKWLIYRAQEYFLKQAEALGFENPEGFENPDEDDDEVTRVLIWEFIIIEAEKLAPVDRKRYGGEEFDSFMAQDTSVLMYEYPDLLHHARMGLKRQKEDRERREHKRRKLTESAGGSAAGGSAGVNAGAPAGGNASSSALTQRYKEEIEALKKDKRDLQSQVSAFRDEVLETRTECAVTTLTLGQLSGSHERLLLDHRSLIGTNPNLSASEIDKLLEDQEFNHERLLKLRVERDVEMGAVETLLEEDPDFVCCITAKVFEDPVVAADGYTYERTAIEKWIRDKILANHNSYVNPRKWNSPRTGEYFASDMVIPNIDKRTTIFNAREDAIKQLVQKRRRF